MRIATRRSLLACLAAAALGIATPASAHAATGPRWQGWLGCWKVVTPPNSSSATTPAPANQLLCVTPTQDPDVVQIAVVSNGSIVSRDRLDASGKGQAIDAGGCQGSTTSKWSQDQRRVFLHSSVTCQGSPSETSAILAMSTAGDWLDVRSVSSGGNSEVRVARYHDAGIPSDVPAEISKALRDRKGAVQAARVATTAPIGTREIIEASHAADPAIVEAWLMESGQHYAVDAATLQQLADAGVPGRVTDAMLSVTQQRGEVGAYASSAGNDAPVEREVPVYDPWGYGVRYVIEPVPVVTYRPVYYYAPPGYSFSLFGFGYAPYGYAYAPFGYYPYAVGYVPFGLGFGYYGRGYYPPTVVVVHEHGHFPITPAGPPRTAQPRPIRSQASPQGYTQNYAPVTRERIEPMPHYEAPRQAAPTTRSAPAPHAEPARHAVAGEKRH